MALYSYGRQDLNALGGKILRVDRDGTAAPGDAMATWGHNFLFCDVAASCEGGAG